MIVRNACGKQGRRSWTDWTFDRFSASQTTCLWSAGTSYPGMAVAQDR